MKWVDRQDVFEVVKGEKDPLSLPDGVVWGDLLGEFEQRLGATMRILNQGYWFAIGDLFRGHVVGAQGKFCLEIRSMGHSAYVIGIDTVSDCIGCVELFIDDELAKVGAKRG
jgi:hypothetical protein